ncbi:protein ARV1 isoform X2 [Scomber japonicus]|uniref:protein ARV1 isoform X2 n=1 Tax=Scomber japonicus TaxID=13676 RepID=UPI002306C261|nr:protein ARV1 isoform X2 [Scomber japonicus]XP_053193523.1 protein ARV1 isoform X2 [Scomber japonicus]
MPFCARRKLSDTFCSTQAWISTGSCVCSAYCVRLTSGGLHFMARSRAVTLLTSSGIPRNGTSTACLDWPPSECLVFVPAELSAFCCGVLWFLWVVVGRLQGRTVELSLLLRALLLSCYGKVLLIPAVIWENDYSQLCLGFIKLFVLTSNSQAIRVILNSSRRLSLTAVCVGLLSETCMAQAITRLPWSIQDMLTSD